MIRAPVVNTVLNSLKSAQQLLLRKNPFLETVESAFPTISAASSNGSSPSITRSPPKEALNLRSVSSSYLWKNACKKVVSGINACLQSGDKAGAQQKMTHLALLISMGQELGRIQAFRPPLVAYVRLANYQKKYEALLQECFDKGVIIPGETSGVNTRMMLSIKVADSAGTLLQRENDAVVKLSRTMSLAHAGKSSLDFTDEDLLGLTDNMKSIWASHVGSAAVWQKTKYKVPTSRDSYQKICGYCQNPDARRKIFDAYFGGFDSTIDEDILELLRVRQELAKAYGMPSYADHELRAQLVGNAAGARQLMDRCWKEGQSTLTPYVKRMELLLDSQAAGIKRTAAPGARKKKAVVSQLEEAFLRSIITKEAQRWKLAEFFPVTCVPKLLDVLGRAYGVTLRELPGNDWLGRLVNGWHKSVKVLEVSDASNRGRRLGYVYLDLFKRSNSVTLPGASSIAPGHISISMQLEAPGFGQNKLFSPEEVIALSHEMGHAIHMLCMGGVPQDFDDLPLDVVELPSTLLESIVLQPSTMSQFASHWQSGAAPPETLINSCQRDAYFFIDYLRSASVSLGLHDEAFNAAEAAPSDVRRVARACWQRYSPVEADPVFCPFGEDAGPYVQAGPSQIAYMSCYLRVDGILFGQAQNAKKKTIPAQQWLNPDFASRIRTQLLDRTFPNRLPALTPSLAAAGASMTPPPHPFPQISGGVAAAVFGRVKQLEV